METEKTLSDRELYKRRAYASDATTSRAAIASSAAELDLCGELGDGAIGPTPPLTVDCNASRDGQCVPVETPAQPWEYAVGLWDEGVWARIDYRRVDPHRYHYALAWKRLENGECESRASVFGDIDGDGIFSTYERVVNYPGPPEWDGEMTHVVNAYE